jgi:amino acid permease
MIAVFIDDLSVVLAFVGATGSTTICYILPGLLYYQMRERYRDPESDFWDVKKRLAVLLCVYGVFVMIVSVGTIFMGGHAH